MPLTTLAIVFLYFSPHLVQVSSIYQSCIFSNPNHLCPGRIRQNDSSNMLPFQPKEFLHKLSNIVIHVVGDSISSQHFKSLICELSSFATPPLHTQIKSFNLTENKIQYLPSWICFGFLHNVTLCYANDVANKGIDFVKTMEPDILIWNAAGLHSHSKSEHLQKISRVLNYAKKYQYYPHPRNETTSSLTSIQRLLIYRETTPQSFVGSFSGDYDERNISNTITTCQDMIPLIQNEQKLSTSPLINLTKFLTYRQVIEREIFQQRDIPLLLVHDETLQLGVSQYIGYPDCSHYCDPGTPNIWNQILYEFILKSPLITLLRMKKLKEMNETVHFPPPSLPPLPHSPHLHLPHHRH